MSSIKLVQQLVLSWYARNGRILPWREKLSPDTHLLRDPYTVLVSECMLQQTQVSRVVPLYANFLKQWPTLHVLKDASLADVIRAWKGLGYNRRAKYLLETAKIIGHVYAGAFPKEKEILKKLPGFGPYMVSALRVFAHGEQETIIDVNILRFLSRVFFGGQDVTKKEIEGMAVQALPRGKADDWHQALMDFGSGICTKNNPTCSTCFLRHLCTANTQASIAGYRDFSEFLKKNKTKMRVSGKDSGKKFIETDRYFRGKIIDYLREKSCPMIELQKYILDDLALGDRVRFGKIIESLVIDGLVAVHISTIALA